MTRIPQPGEAVISASGKLQTYGYHNTFQSHASPTPESKPPTYEYATSQKGIVQRNQEEGSEELPAYRNEVHFEGFLDVKAELSSPFLISLDNDWHNVYVVLDGTQLSMFKVKTSLFRSRAPRQGRLIQTFSLQHAEIGIAADWRKEELVPKATFAKVLPRAAQLKLAETDPEMFEPTREFVFRLRAETEQMIFCAPTHERLLDWVEEICVGIDISPPIDDRSEPRYRSLPRRTRRQRLIEASAQQSTEILSREEMERRVMEEQERIIKRLYPGLAAISSDAVVVGTIDRTEDRPEVEREGGQDPDAEDLDPADARENIGESNATGPRAQSSSQSLRSLATESYDPKTAPAHARPSKGALCRFRRRCAPILLATSQRASPIIFCNGVRYQVDTRRCQLIPFEKKPPRYNAHTPPATSAAFTRNVSSAFDGILCRPSMSRGVTAASNNSNWSNASAEIDTEEERESLHSTISGMDRITPVTSSDSQLYSGKGKGKALLVSLQKAAAGSFKTMHGLSQYDDSEMAAVLASHTPLLI